MLDCFYTEFSRLQNQDEEFKITFTRFKDHTCKLFSHEREKNIFRRKILIKLSKYNFIQKLSGSVSEGSSTARLFKENINNRYFQWEVDVEARLLDLPSSFKHMVNDDMSKPGYLSLKLRYKDILNCPNCTHFLFKRNIESHFSRIVSGNGYVNPFTIKTKHFNKTYSKKKFLELHFFSALLLQRAPQQLYIHQQKILTKASYKKVLAFCLEQYTFNFEYEEAYLIRLRWQPNLTRQWARKPRNWPKNKELSEELKEGFVIAKTSKEEKENIHSTQLRYSFAHLERKIISLRSRHQNLIYLIFKSMYYRWIHGIDQEYLTSFLAKTVMFWFCDEYPPDHQFWDFYGSKSVVILKQLFVRLKTAFQYKRLSYYFVPEINLVKDLPVVSRFRAFISTDKILRDIESYIPKDVEKKLMQFNALIEPVKKVLNILENSVEDNSLLVRNGLELLAAHPKEYIDFWNKKIKPNRQNESLEDYAMFFLREDLRMFTSSIRYHHNYSYTVKKVSLFLAVISFFFIVVIFCIN